MNPQSPLKQAGILIEPPRSAPIPIGEHLEATRAPSPPLEPPGVLLTSHGFLDLPKILLLASQVIAN